MGQTVDQTRLNPPGVISATFYSGGTGIQPIFGLAPSGTYPFNFTLPTIPPSGINASGGLVGTQPAVDSLDRNMVPPLAVNYVISIERQLPYKLVAGASYSGSKSYDQLTGMDVNRYAGGAVITGSGSSASEAVTRLNPNFGPITYVTNKRYSNYNAMILTLRGRQGNRGNFQASYTLAQAKDYPEENTRFDQDTEPATIFPDQNAYFSYYGNANYDVRQRFSASGQYTDPGHEKRDRKSLDFGLGTEQHRGCPDWLAFLGLQHESANRSSLSRRLQPRRPQLGCAKLAHHQLHRIAQPSQF